MTPWANGRVLADVPDDGPRLPLEAVKDLRAIARALYLALGKMGPAHEAQRFKVQAIGRQLNLAIEKATKGAPGTWHHTTAWLIAERATEELTAMIDVYLPARALITAAGERIRRKR